MTSAYTSTVVAPVHIAVAAVVGTALAVAATTLVLIWSALVVGVVVLASGVQLSVVRTAIGPDRIVVGGGRWSRGRVIAVERIAEISATDVTWAQAFGVGVRTTRRTTRLTVRAGPTLTLRLIDDEIVRISIDDPHAALRVMRLPTAAQKETR